ncbi:DNA-binding MurR/RpiR family transcriptional regulator [Lactobacillus colini]|uniref:DNA-binding MurR/RpiR family transcriptional regulator n=1 Tax=Lactobacillus colini TaxID=1819254 RepID=A0ABS4MF20_9LACO|nr:MurR/RpiR family transcriptional regulator [Lactobacillus colini]MBP2058213.1 DNA-binding MurR/RpiR family transcriptional regulator [Lactobacillus colini]
MTLIDNIIRKKDSLSSSEKAVANYILKNQKPIATITIAKIANESQTSISAVQRFCQTMGFKGFKDFKFALQSYELINQKSNIIDTDDNIINAYQQVLQTMNDVNKDILHQLTKDLINSSVNFILGSFYSSIPANYLSLALNDLGYLSISIDDSDKASHLINTINNDSTIVVFSISGDAGAYQDLFSSLSDSLPQKSYLITMNPNASQNSLFSNIIILPAKNLDHISVIDPQGINIIFIERLINSIYKLRKK